MNLHHDARHRQVSALLDGGEYACSFGQIGTLSHVCHQLATLLDDQALASRASQVATMADRDAGSATRLWAELADRLR